jgi:hypothetical protein
MSSLSMATAVCARNCAGAAASTPAMAIAATLKYRPFLHLIRALLVRLIVMALCVGGVRAAHVCALGAIVHRSMPLRNNAGG